MNSLVGSQTTTTMIVPSQYPGGIVPYDNTSIHALGVEGANPNLGSVDISPQSFLGSGAFGSHAPRPYATVPIVPRAVPGNPLKYCVRGDPMFVHKDMHEKESLIVPLFYLNYALERVARMAHEEQKRIQNALSMGLPVNKRKPPHPNADMTDSDFLSQYFPTDVHEFMRRWTFLGFYDDAQNYMPFESSGQGLLAVTANQPVAVRVKGNIEDVPNLWGGNLHHTGQRVGFIVKKVTNLYPDGFLNMEGTRVDQPTKDTKYLQVIPWTSPELDTPPFCSHYLNPAETTDRDFWDVITYNDGQRTYTSEVYTQGGYLQAGIITHRVKVQDTHDSKMAARTANHSRNMRKIATVKVDVERRYYGPV